MEGFREQVCCIVLASNMSDNQQPFGDAIAYEVLANRDMLHLAMRVWIMRAGHCPLIIAEYRGW